MTAPEKRKPGLLRRWRASLRRRIEGSVDVSQKLGAARRGAGGGRKRRPAAGPFGQ
jgi:hypothetical protein